MVQQVPSLPAGAKQAPGVILAHGELTGHTHRIEDPASVQLWSAGDETYLEVLARQARLVHEEHHSIELPRGIYRCWQQREYTPAAIVRVSD